MVDSNATELAISLEFLENLLVKIAETNLIPPLWFVMAMRSIPGYDLEKAPQLENQWFDSAGWPTPHKPKEI